MLFSQDIQQHKEFVFETITEYYGKEISHLIENINLRIDFDFIRHHARAGEFCGFYENTQLIKLNIFTIQKFVLALPEEIRQEQFVKCYKYVIVHELAHVIDFNLFHDLSNSNNWWSYQYISFFKSLKLEEFPTKYATTNIVEFFAESMCAFLRVPLIQDCGFIRYDINQDIKDMCQKALEEFKSYSLKEKLVA